MNGPWTDRVVLAAIAAGTLLRGLPLALWGHSRCIADECSYVDLARVIAAGGGLQTVNDWLWAPGYPWFLGAFTAVFGSTGDAKLVQVALGGASIGLVAAIAERVDGRRAARTAAWLLALHPTVAFFATALWPETIYVFLLLGAALAALVARERGWRAALLAGALLGGCVLLRGVATALPPVFAAGLLWPEGEGWREAVRRRGASAAALVLAAALVVLPWSVHASLRHGGLVVTDTTLGQMMWQGNNTFAPLTYDYGLVADDQGRTRGRPHCPSQLPAARWSQCEIRRATQWIAENPTTFLGRVPLRLAQLVNPNSFLTRHVRLGLWEGIPAPVADALSALVTAWSALVIGGGTVAAWARARGGYGAIAVGTVLYHVAVVAGLAGLSRFRVPLEPLWLVFLAGALARPVESWRALAEGPRAVGALLTVPPLLALMLWYVEMGFA